MTGEKHDEGKLRWDLLPFAEVREIVRVLTFGAAKYSPDNWKSVQDHRARYFSALMRHIDGWWGGETNDKESGIHHHAGCCLLFLMGLDRMNEIKTTIAQRLNLKMIKP